MAPLVGDARGSRTSSSRARRRPGAGASRSSGLSGPPGRRSTSPGRSRPRLPARPAPRRAVLSPFLDEDGASSTRGSSLYFAAPRLGDGRGGRRAAVARLARRSSRPSSRRRVARGARRARPGEFTRRALANGKLDLVDGRGDRAARGGREPRGGPPRDRPRAGRALAAGRGAPGGAVSASSRSSRRGWTSPRTSSPRARRPRLAARGERGGARRSGRGGRRRAIERGRAATVVIVGAPERREVDALQRARRRGPGPRDGAPRDDAGRRRRDRRDRGRAASGSSTPPASGRRRSGSSGSAWRRRAGRRRGPTSSSHAIEPGGYGVGRGSRFPPACRSSSSRRRPTSGGAPAGSGAAREREDRRGARDAPGGDRPAALRGRGGGDVRGAVRGSGRRSCAARGRAGRCWAARPPPSSWPRASARALHALGEITGETATEELLDRIFSTFCIGK